MACLPRRRLTMASTTRSVPLFDGNPLLPRHAIRISISPDGCAALLIDVSARLGIVWVVLCLHCPLYAFIQMGWPGRGRHLVSQLRIVDIVVEVDFFSEPEAELVVYHPCQWLEARQLREARI